ncbi:MAG: 3-deoxy-manno-octulosonate cytidylyltransferase, partial [Synergistaceae bacterium]|nr:3-deoxy-manno-octulosonate cytidylyltransferase [Synergistaceae bacterium]
GGFDAVINIQGDEPLLDPVMIDEVAGLLRENYCATLCREMSEDFADPNTVKVVMTLEGYALYFSRSLIPYKRNESSLPVYQHIGIYGYSAEFLRKYIGLSDTPLSMAESLEQLRILEHGYRIKVGVTGSKGQSIGVDTPEDLVRVRKLMNAEI